MRRSYSLAVMQALVKVMMFLMTALTMMAALPANADTVKNWPPKTFPITFWCGPPEPYITTAQYRKIADAGFTVVMPPCEGEATVQRNRRILDTAQATKMKAIISDSRMPVSITGNPNGLANLKAIVKDYSRHPALMGYFITDEPGASAFAGLGEVVGELRKLDPDHIAYINLLPNYATSDLNTTPSQLGTDTYARYLDRYIQTVKPDIVSWDHYHFTTNGDRIGFFGNLYAVQRAVTASEPALPFWQIVLSVQHGPYRALTESELRYEAMQTLVFGASGLAYFTYWQPNDPSFKWSNSIMNRDGTPGPLYEPAKKVNSEVKTLEKYLFGAIPVETWQTGEVPPDGHAPLDDLPVKMTGPGNLSVGFFRGAGGFVYVLVTNRDYKQPVKSSLSLHFNNHEVETLDLISGKWKKNPPVKGSSIDLDFELPPAGAALYRWL